MQRRPDLPGSEKHSCGNGATLRVCAGTHGRSSLHSVQCGRAAPGAPPHTREPRPPRGPCESHVAISSLKNEVYPSPKCPKTGHTLFSIESFPVTKKQCANVLHHSGCPPWASRLRRRKTEPLLNVTKAGVGQARAQACFLRVCTESQARPLQTDPRAQVCQLAGGRREFKAVVVLCSHT